MRRAQAFVAWTGFGDDEQFEAEYAELPELGPLIGFTPTHDMASS